MKNIIARAIAVETPTTITAMTIHRYMGILVEPGASGTDGTVDSVVDSIAAVT